MLVLPDLAYSQCGTWDAKIISIQKVDTSFIITGKNYMPDCKTPSGIYFEWQTDQNGASELKKGMRIDFDKWKPQKGYWKYLRLYSKSTK